MSKNKHSKIFQIIKLNVSRKTKRVSKLIISFSFLMVVLGISASSAYSQIVFGVVSEPTKGCYSFNNNLTILWESNSSGKESISKLRKSLKLRLEEDYPDKKYYTGKSSYRQRYFAISKYRVKPDSWNCRYNRLKVEFGDTRREARRKALDVDCHSWFTCSTPSILREGSW